MAKRINTSGGSSSEEQDKILEDLGIKVAETPEKALWTRVKTTTEQIIKEGEDSLIVNKEILALAEKKLNETR